MENYFLLTVILCALFGCFHFATKILDWLEKKKKYPSNKQEFISDLYKVQMKWTKKGEYDYSQSINLIIVSFNLPESQKLAETEDARYAQERMRKSNEFIDTA